MTLNAISRAAAIAGGQSALARKLGCTPQNVSRMCATGKVPADRVASIVTAVDGLVTREELRPDLYAELAVEPSTA